MALEKKAKLTGESGVWELQDGVWIKDMATYKIKREGIDSF
jgi:hypothetical protein